jgi:small subunit ribosomal protein S8e
MHKRRLTGGTKPTTHKKRKFNLGRQPAMTKLGPKLVRQVRVRGGSVKNRGLRLETGSFAWGSEAHAAKTRILNVVYNSTNNELVRTNTLVKGCIVQIDATPFRHYYLKQYGEEIGKKKADEADADAVSERVQKKRTTRASAPERVPLDSALAEVFSSGRLLARVASRPGQCGRCDGYIIEGKELEFYVKASTFHARIPYRVIDMFSISGNAMSLSVYNLSDNSPRPLLSLSMFTRSGQEEEDDYQVIILTEKPVPHFTACVLSQYLACSSACCACVKHKRSWLVQGCATPRSDPSDSSLM